MKAAKPILLSILLAALLVACGDDVSANDDENGGTSPTTMTDERDGQAYRIVTRLQENPMARTAMTIVPTPAPSTDVSTPGPRRWIRRRRAAAMARPARRIPEGRKASAPRAGICRVARNG